MSGVLVIHVSGCFNLPGASISSSFFTVGHSQNYKWAINPSAPLLKWSQQLEAQKRDQCPSASVALLSGYILKKAISLRNDSDTFLVTSWGKLYKIFHPHFPFFFFLPMTDLLIAVLILFDLIFPVATTTTFHTLPHSSVTVLKSLFLVSPFFFPG